MYLDDYQHSALTTASGINDLVNVALGLTGEAGEFADHIKKVIYHGHDLDRVYVRKELGDILWYVAVGASLVDTDLSMIARINVDKLKARYPEGFSSEASINRTS